MDGMLIWGNRTEVLTHWGRMTHKYISNLTTIGSDNGLSPGRRQANIRTNAGILWVPTLGRKFSGCLSKIFHSRKCIWKYRLEIADILFRPQCIKQIFIYTVCEKEIPDEKYEMLRITNRGKQIKTQVKDISAILQRTNTRLCPFWISEMPFASLSARPEIDRK